MDDISDLDHLQLVHIYKFPPKIAADPTQVNTSIFGDYPTHIPMCSLVDRPLNHSYWPQPNPMCLDGAL